MHSSDVQASPDLFCLGCGYDLRGIDSLRCPECGREFDPAQPPSRIPWVHRIRIGRIRAYFETLWMLTRHPFQVAEEASRPVCEKSARHFRRINVALALIPILILPMLIPEDLFVGSFWSLLEDVAFRPLARALPNDSDCITTEFGTTRSLPTLSMPLKAGLMRPVIVAFAILLPFLLTAIPTRLLCPHDTDAESAKRAASLTRYCGAILGLVGVFAFVMCISGLCVSWYEEAFGYSRRLENSWLIFLAIPAGAAMMVMEIWLFICGLSTLVMLRTACRCSTVRTIGFAILWPAWNLLLVVGPLLLVGWVIGFFRIVIHSVR